VKISDNAGTTQPKQEGKFQVSGFEFQVSLIGALYQGTASAGPQDGSLHIGFSRCTVLCAGAKALISEKSLSARLKPCPDTKLSDTKFLRENRLKL
jgi:hypothetical protein